MTLTLKRSWLLWYVGVMIVFIAFVGVVLIRRQAASTAAYERVQSFDAVFDPGSPSVGKPASLHFTVSGTQLESDVQEIFPLVTAADEVLRALDFARRLRRAVTFATTAVESDYVLPDFNHAKWDLRGVSIPLTPEQKRSLRGELESFRRVLGYLVERLNEHARMIQSFADASNYYDAILKARAGDAVGPAIEAMARFDAPRTEERLVQVLSQSQRGLPVIAEEVRSAHMAWLLERAPGLMERIFEADPDLVLWGGHPPALAEAICAWLAKNAGPRQFSVLLRCPGLRRSPGRMARFHEYFETVARTGAAGVTDDDVIAALNTLSRDISPDYKKVLGILVVNLPPEPRRRAFLWTMENATTVGRPLYDWLLDTMFPRLTPEDFETLLKGQHGAVVVERLRKLVEDDKEAMTAYTPLMLKTLELQIPPYENPVGLRKLARSIAQHARPEHHALMLEAALKLPDTFSGYETRLHPRYVFADHFLGKGNEAAAVTLCAAIIPTASDAQMVELLHEKLKSKEHRMRLVELALKRLENGALGEDAVARVLRNPEGLDVLPRVIAAYYKFNTARPDFTQWFGRIVRAIADKRATTFLIREWVMIALTEPDEVLQRVTGLKLSGHPAWWEWLEKNKGSLKDQLGPP